MPISWSTALGAQDQSLEAQMARRDVSKLQNMLLNVSKEGENRRQFGEEQKFKEKQLEETSALRKSQQEYLQHERQAAAERARIDDTRQNYTALTSGQKPGMSYTASQMPLIREHGREADYEQNPNDPNRFIYMRHEAERLAAKAKQDEELEIAREKRQQEAQKIAQAQLELSRKAGERADKDAERRDKAYDARQRAIDAKANELTITGRQKVAAKVRDIEKAIQPGGGLFGVFGGLAPEDAMTKKMDMIESLYNEELDKERKFKGMPPLMGGRGAAPGAGTPQGETPEQRIQRLLGKGGV